MSDDLRPIGSEVEHCFPPSFSCTDSAFVIWKYRIAGYSETIYGLRERLEPIEQRRFVPTHYVQWMGRSTPVPPRECLPLLDAGWGALFEHSLTEVVPKPKKTPQNS